MLSTYEGCVRTRKDRVSNGSSCYVYVVDGSVRDELVECRPLNDVWTHACN